MYLFEVPLTLRNKVAILSRCPDCLRMINELNTKHFCPNWPFKENKNEQKR